MDPYPKKIVSELQSEGWTVEWRQVENNLWQVEAHFDGSARFKAENESLIAALIELDHEIRIRLDSGFSGTSPVEDENA